MARTSRLVSVSLVALTALSLTACEACYSQQRSSGMLIPTEPAVHGKTLVTEKNNNLWLWPWCEQETVTVSPETHSTVTYTSNGAVFEETYPPYSGR